MRIQRLLGLLSILASVEKITAQELADRFEVSKRTIFRDIDMLNCAGIPIVSYPGLGGGVSIVEGYKVDKRVLSTDDTEKIFTALSGLKSIDGDVSVNNLIAKLAPVQEAELYSRSHYVMDLSSWFSDSLTHEKADALHQAISQQRLIHMVYISKTSRSARTVEPHKLIFKQSYWYLYAFCHSRNEFRLFRLNRIVSYDITDEHFQTRPTDRIESERDYGPGIYSLQYREGFTEILLEYDGDRAFELTSRIDASLLDQTAVTHRGHPSIRFYTSDLSGTADFIMSMGDLVRAISPPELVHEIRRRLDKIYLFYKG